MTERLGRVTSSNWRVAFRAPNAVVRLPVQSTEDPGPWARAIVAELMAPHASGDPEADAEQATGLTDRLIEATYDSRSREPIAALSFLPDVTDGELARIELRSVPERQDRPPVSLDALADFFTLPSVDGIDEPEVVRGDLPIGPAVRVRRQFGANKDEFETSLVVQTVVYAVRPPELDAGVALFMSWTAIVHNERLFDLADRLASTLRLERHDEAADRLS